MGAAEVIVLEEVRASKQWDTLRHHLELQRMRQVDDGERDGGVVRVADGVADAAVIGRLCDGSRYRLCYGRRCRDFVILGRFSHCLSRERRAFVTGLAKMFDNRCLKARVDLQLCIKTLGISLKRLVEQRAVLVHLGFDAFL